MDVNGDRKGEEEEEEETVPTHLPIDVALDRVWT